MTDGLRVLGLILSRGDNKVARIMGGLRSLWLSRIVDYSLVQDSYMSN